MTLAPAEELQADTDDSNGAYVIGLILAAFGGGIMGGCIALVVVGVW